MRFVEIGNDHFAIAFFLGVRLPGSVQLEEFLDTVVASRNDVPALLDDSIFGLDFFEEMGDFGGQVCHLNRIVNVVQERKTAFLFFDEKKEKMHTILNELF